MSVTDSIQSSLLIRGIEKDGRTICSTRRRTESVSDSRRI